MCCECQQLLSGEKPYACKLEGCDKAFAQMANLQHHMRMHNKDGTKPHDPTEKPYKCDECFQEFHTQRGVNCHKQKVHTNYHILGLLWQMEKIRFLADEKMLIVLQNLKLILKT